MKKAIVIICSILLLTLMTSCEKARSNDTSQNNTESQSEVSEVKTPDITNLNYDNGNGRMADTDGPAYVVYSKKGYNKATLDVLVSDIKLNNVRKSDRKFVNAYLFLGIDMYDSEGNWVNCADTGLCYSGVNGYWHLFYNLYSTKTEGAQTWYESSVRLNSKHDYRLILDSSKENDKASITVYDITDNKTADSKEFEAAYSLADGANTSFLQNYALDYPEDVKLDTNGKPTDDNFKEITLYNSDQGIYMSNIEIAGAHLYKGNNEVQWTSDCTENRGIWPDKNVGIDFEIVKIYKNSFDNLFTVSFDMNRSK